MTTNSSPEGKDSGTAGESDDNERSGLAETIASINEQDPDEPTFLRADDVKQRMKTRGGSAQTIADTFGTVESLFEACAADDDLTEHDGIGPATEGAIRDWWENRFKREEMASSQTVTPTGKKTATVTFHKSWENAIGSEVGR